MKSQSCMGCWDHKLLSLCVAVHFVLYFILLSPIIFLCIYILTYKDSDWPYYVAHPVEKAKREHRGRHFHYSEPWWIQFESTVQAGSAGPTSSNRIRVISLKKWEQQELHNLTQATHEASKDSGKCVPLFSKENRFLKGNSLAPVPDRTTLTDLECSIVTSVTGQLQRSQKPNSSLAWDHQCLPTRKNA